VSPVAWRLLGRLWILGYHAGGMVWFDMDAPARAAETTARTPHRGRVLWWPWQPARGSGRSALVARTSSTLTLVLVLACGSGLVGQTYRHGDIAFDVGPIPACWHPVDADDAALAFRDDAAKVTVAVNARCHEQGDDVPLETLTNHLFLEFTDRRIIDQRPLQLDGRAALRTQLLADLDGVPMHFTVYVLKKDWCVYDFMHIAAPDSPATSRAQFDQFVAGFATLR
jgi:hypothetical protein